MSISRAGEFAFFHENVMGTSLELRVRAATETAANQAEARVLAEIDRLSAILSNHDPESELRRWQEGRGEGAKVSPSLFAVLQASDRWRAASGGAFDPRVQSIVALWRNAARADRIPSPSEIRDVLATMRMPAWRLDAQTSEATWLGGASVTLDAIAKGFIVEQACDAAAAGHPEVAGVLLNVGGDLRARGDLDRIVGISPPRGDSESAEPFTFVNVRDRAMATSGDSQRGLTIQGTWYSHIFDPRTGAPAHRVVEASVIAKSSADADAMATILNVLSPDEGLALVHQTEGAECLIVAADGKIFRSAGWAKFEVNDAPPAIAFAAPKPGAAADAAPQDDEFEMLVEFEIKAPEGTNKRRYRRPYVAIWLDDKDGNPVRNLVLWVSLGGSGPDRWLPDLKKWYPSDKKRKETDDLDLVFTAARATRAPGKYSVVWDGKDNHGKPLPRGEYTLTIETAREHGTYQILRKSLTVADTPFAEELKGNAEIQSASIAYRRKTPAVAK